jgi:putative spermidine/putrescine transport system permease protein
MWFGIVYLGSLLTLLWQSVYTFDDFTMSVTTDLTLANLRRCLIRRTTTSLSARW